MERGSLRNYCMNVLFRSKAFKIIMELSEVAHPPLVDIYIPKKKWIQQESSTKNSQNGFLEDKEKLFLSWN